MSQTKEQFEAELMMVSKCFAMYLTGCKKVAIKRLKEMKPIQIENYTSLFEEIKQETYELLRKKLSHLKEEEDKIQ